MTIVLKSRARDIRGTLVVSPSRVWNTSNFRADGVEGTIISESSGQNIPKFTTFLRLRIFVEITPGKRFSLVMTFRYLKYGTNRLNISSGHKICSKECRFCSGHAQNPARLPPRNAQFSGPSDTLKVLVNLLLGPSDGPGIRNALRNALNFRTVRKQFYSQINSGK